MLYQVHTIYLAILSFIHFCSASYIPWNKMHIICDLRKE